MLHNRRTFISTATAGIGALAAMGVLSSDAHAENETAPPARQGASYDSFPRQKLDMVRDFVGSAHKNFDRVRGLRETDPELVRAAWDWGFGDWESALGAASHMGRLDIGQYLLDHGARADIFSLVLLGKLDAVQAMLAADKSLATAPGPHGIPLLMHAEAALGFPESSPEQKANAQRVYDFLQTVEGAAGPPATHVLDEKSRDEYLGKYIYGSGDEEVVVISVNMMGILSLKPGASGAQPIIPVAPDEFTFRAARSVRVQFARTDAKLSGLTIFAHGDTVRATRE